MPVRDRISSPAITIRTDVDYKQALKLMHRNVVTATPDAPITEAATLMVDDQIGALPVIDTGQRVVGVITEPDIFRAFVDRLVRPPAPGVSKSA
jgi:CBS domain-containing protein